MKCCRTEEKRLPTELRDQEVPPLTEQHKHTQPFMQRTVTEDVDGNSGKLFGKCALITPSKRYKNKKEGKTMRQTGGEV